MKKSRSAAPLIIAALIFLCNPNVNIIDILPDFAAYLIILKVIGKSEDIIPYLAECKSAVKRLLILSLIKLPISFVMISQLHTGRDIIPLFTTAFAALEVIFIFSAVTNLFKALYYLGERSSATALITPFRMGKAQTDPDTLKGLTLLFVVAKAVLSALPEFCLLTFASYSATARANKIYPYLLLSCVLIVAALGIIWVVTSTAYTKNILKSSQIEDAIISLADEEKLEEIEKKSRVKAIISSLALLAASTLFTFDIVFQDISDANILPRFFYIIILYSSFAKLPTEKKDKLVVRLTSIGVGITSVLLFISEVRFFDRFSYLDIGSNSLAKSLYLPIEIFSVAETIFISATLITIAKVFTGFIKSHTGISPDNNRYSKTDKDNHQRLIIRSLPIFVTPLILSVIRCVNVFMKPLTEVSIIDSAGGLISFAPMPWLGTLCAVISVILAIYSFYTVAELKSEVKMKYYDVHIENDNRLI